MKKILIIISVGLLIYGFALFNGFVWDDEVMFQTGTSLQQGAYFRPVITAVYWSIYNIFGPRPFFFHFFQLIFHIATAVLIFYLFKRFFKETISFFLALVFLVHPALVEAVSFASAMQEVAFTLTGIAGLYLFVIPLSGIQTKIDYIKIFSAAFLLLIALLMKETAVVFFPLVFCYLLFFKRKQAGILVNYSIFTVILLMIYLLARISSGNLYVQGQGLFPIMRVSIITRLINIPMIILYYLGKFFYPVNLATAQHWVVRAVNFHNFWLPLIIIIGFFLLSIAGFVYVSSPRRRGSSPLGLINNDDFSLDSRLRGNAYAFFFLWFLFGLFPHLQIIPLNMTVAERWLYFPMIGLLGMMGAIMSSSRRRGSSSPEFVKSSNYSLDSHLRGNDKLILIIGILIISIFSIRSFIRVLDWRNGLSLFSRDIRSNSSFDLQNNLGTELFRVSRYSEAKKYFEKSVQLAPYWWVNWNNLGVVYEHEKNYQKAAEYYQKSINNGQYYLAYENLAKILVFHGNNQKKAEEFLQKAMKLFPENQNILTINTYFQEKNNKK